MSDHDRWQRPRPRLALGCRETELCPSVSQGGAPARVAGPPPITPAAGNRQDGTCDGVERGDRLRGR